MKKNNYSAQILYKLKVEFNPTRDKKYKAIVPFTIKQGITEQRFSVSYEKSTPIVSCKCISKGTTHLKAHLDKNAYLPTETAKLMLEVDNSACRMSISNIEITLLRTIRLKNQNDHATFYIRDKLKTLKARGVPASTGLLATNALQVDFNLGDVKEIIDECCSSKGAKTECAYSYEIKAVMGSREDPSFEVWTLIHPMDLAPHVLVPPEEWAPTEFLNARLTIDDKSFHYLPSAPSFSE